MNLEIDVRWAADSNELVLELKPTVDDLNYNRIIGLLREFVPVESEQKAVFKRVWSNSTPGRLRNLSKGSWDGSTKWPRLCDCCFLDEGAMLRKVINLVYGINLFTFAVW